MPDETTTPKPNRTPWIIAGVLGCLVLCLLLVVIGGGAYYLTSNNTTAANSLTRVAAQPTLPPVTVPPVPTIVLPTVVLPTVIVPTVVLPTLPAVQPTQPVVQPTQPVVQPTLPAIAILPAATVAQPTATATVSATTTTAPTKTPVVTAPTGKIAFTVRRGDRPEDNSIWIMNADGSGAKQILTRSSEPSFSPDGTKIAYYQWSDGIFVANADGTNSKKILGEAASGYLSWSHDGRWIAFSVRPGRTGNIATDAIAPDGTGRRPVVVGWSPSWSPDDTQVVFQTCRGSDCGIFKAASSGGDAIPVITDDGGLAAWSPDGKIVLYQKDVDGQKQLFVINTDGTGKKQLTAGASLHVSANWSSDGKFIFYRSPEGGQWGIWRMNADGTNPVKIANDMPPGDWPYDRIAVTK